MRIKKVFIDFLKNFVKFRPKKVKNYCSRTNFFNKTETQIIEQSYIIKKIKKYKKKKILDYGCNDCFLSKLLGPHYTYYGIDNNKELLNKKMKIYSKNFFFSKNDLIPFKKDYFDCVVLSHVIPHIYNPDKLIKKIKKILKKDGILIVVSPNKFFKFLYFFLNLFNKYVPDETISKNYSLNDTKCLFDNNWDPLECIKYSIINNKIKNKLINSRFMVILKKIN